MEMKNFMTFSMFVLLAFVSSVQCNFDENFEYSPGNCQTHTIEFIASLVSLEARRTLNLEHRQPKNLRYHLYTRQNPNQRQNLKPDDSKSLMESNFNSLWPVRLIIQGWLGRNMSCAYAAVKDAYLSRGDFNVILIDWSDYSYDAVYFRLMKEFLGIAKQINEFTRFLHTQTGVAYKDMYLIGHSLGAHLSGVVARLLKPDMYGVIYALDPAGPLFKNPSFPSRIRQDDATYIESIHSDINIFGISAADFSHAAFFPNYGLGQTHCPNVTATEANLMCDHLASVFYFAESIRNNHAFGAIRCKDFKSVEQKKCRCKNGEKECKAEIYMGGEPATPKRGIFYLSTNNNQPYGYGNMVFIKKPLPSSITKLNGSDSII